MVFGGMSEKHFYEAALWNSISIYRKQIALLAHALVPIHSIRGYILVRIMMMSNTGVDCIVFGYFISLIVRS